MDNTQFQQWPEKSTSTIDNHMFDSKHEYTQSQQVSGSSSARSTPTATHPELLKAGSTDPFFLDHDPFATQYDFFYKRPGGSSPLPTEAEFLEYWRLGAFDGGLFPPSSDYTFNNPQDSTFTFEEDFLSSSTFNQKQWDLPFQPSPSFPPPPPSQEQEQSSTTLSPKSSPRPSTSTRSRQSLSGNTPARPPIHPRSQTISKYNTSPHSVDNTPRNRELTRTYSVGNVGSDIGNLFPGTIQSHYKPYVSPYARPANTQYVGNGISDTTMWDVGSNEQVVKERSSSGSHVTAKSPRVCSNSA
jgi:hypothetical protein